jgi:hypothetical protein
MDERVTGTTLLLMLRYGELIAYCWSLELVAGYRSSFEAFTGITIVILAKMRKFSLVSVYGNQI